MVELYVCGSFYSTGQLLNQYIVVTLVYPGIFVVACMAATMSGLSSTYQTWLQHVRDKEFVVEMRLQNREPNAPEQGPKTDDAPNLVDAV
jgi:hypothetical protein